MARIGAGRLAACFGIFFFSSRRRHTRSLCDWSSDVCSSDLHSLPTVMPSSDVGYIGEIARRTYRDRGGSQRPYLTEDEVQLLAIPRGSLAPDERRQIESHVVHSFQFLVQIPWTQDYKRIPEIARAHHEKLNGKGYPAGLTGTEIPVQAKMMTICDIFDALSATDRPYKRAVPTDRALDILNLCVQDAEVDAELFRMFVESQVYRVAVKS